MKRFYGWQQEHMMPNPKCSPIAKGQLSDLLNTSRMLQPLKRHVWFLSFPACK